LGSSVPAVAQLASGTVVENTARVTYELLNRSELTGQSNRVRLTVVPTRTFSRVEFLQARPGLRSVPAVTISSTAYSTSGSAGGPFTEMPAPMTPAGVPIDLSRPLPLEIAAVFFQGEPVFLRVLDADQNLDALAVDTVLLQVGNEALGDLELLRLRETGPNTGQFLGYLQTSGQVASQAKDGLLSVRQDQIATSTYVDARDPADRAAGAATFDPVGHVFDSRTGQPVDGVTVRLVDQLTGAPADVSGNDAGSRFPATITTGLPVTDESGTTYNFGPGGFRFPHPVDGQYRLEIAAPPGYRAPSRLSDAEIRLAPGGPFALTEAGSRGEPFFAIGQPLLIDLPVDRADTDLFVTKSAGKASVTVGEYLSYEIRVANTTDDEATGLLVSDRLPAGFRYQPGSTVVDGRPAADPQLSADGRTLEFTGPVGLPAGAVLAIRYVAGVVPGAAVGTAINRAHALWGGGISNEATARINVRPDIFGTMCTIVGRVMGFDCEGDPQPEAAGIPGVRILVESGAFAVTDQEGRYHLAGLAPGAHVVQMDLASLPAQYVPGACLDAGATNAHPWSRLVDLQGGTMWRSDFQLQRVPPATGALNLTLGTTLLGTRIDGQALLATDKVPLRNPRLTILLPQGTSYRPGSSRLGSRLLPEPHNDDGTLVFHLDDLPIARTDTLHFGADVTSPLVPAELAVKGLLVADTPTARSVRSRPVQTVLALSPEVVREEQPEIVLRPRFASLSADLSPLDMALIDTVLDALAGQDVVAVKVIGHTDNQPVRPGAHPQYRDNLSLSLARAEAVGGHIQRALHLGESQLAVYGLGDREPAADNATATGRALNRRVTLQIWTEKTTRRLPTHAVRDYAHTRLALQGFRPGETWPAAAGTVPVNDMMPAFDGAWLATATPGPRLLWPPEGHLPHIPALKLAVQHAAADSVHLLLNGKPAGRLNFAGRAIAADGIEAVSTWAGIDLQPGDNELTAVIGDPGPGQVRLSRLVHYSGPPVFAEVLPAPSVLVADGRTRPVIALRLTDAAGFPARREVVGKFTVAAPHEAWHDRGEQQRESLGGMPSPVPTYTVGTDGIARLELAPTTESGEVLLNVGLLDHEEEVRVWLQPAARDWVLAGICEGTVGYSTVSGNLETLAAANREDDFYAEGRLAFFAKGRLKGSWLLTLAYDSREQAPGARDGLFGTVDPDAYYTVYGDATEQQHDAPTGDQLYVRLDRAEFYALYGDFHTGLTITDLADYSRAMTGLRTCRRGQQLGFDAFVSENRQSFRREEIHGDGTSGLYRLATGSLIPHSEKIVLQTRDRYRPELVLAERHLARSVDYSLDDLDGSLFFKEPVPSQDQNFNPIWIVVAYETETLSAAEVTGGGRGAWRPGAGAVEIGLTGIREGKAGGRADVLVGVDTRWDLSRALRLKAEYAGTDTRTGGRADAWFGELANRSGPVLGRLLYRQQAAGFGLGQLNAGESGTRKYGLDLRWQLASVWRLDCTAFSQTNLVRGASRQLGELKLGRNGRRLSAGVGLRATNDETAAGTLQQSRQATAEAAVKVLANRGRLRLAREQGLSGQDQLADFPTRTSLGLEYEVLRDQKIFLAQELVDGAGPASQRTRLGVELVPWRGARLTTSAERRTRESDRRVYANAGLAQSLRLNEAWHLDGSLDHGRHTRSAADTLAAAAGPDEGFTAGSLGATWRSGRWLVNQRLEYRTGETAEKWGLISGLHVEPGRDLGLLASVRLLRTTYRPGGRHALSDVSVGLAWRPSASPWTVLQRLSYRTEDKTGTGHDLANWRVVNHVNAVRTLGDRNQVSGQIGVRYNRDLIDGLRYAGFSDQTGLEWRHFLGRRWDVGLRGSSRHGWQSGVVDYSTGVSGGVKLLEDLWLSLGYNFAGYHDRDFSAADHTAQGPYLRFRLRLNQEMTRAWQR
jgi:uncharacterized repeat protein (TIGR01451 family)